MKMMKMIAAAVLLAGAGAAPGAGPAPFPFTVNSQSPSVPSLESFRGEQRVFRVTFTDGSNAVNLSGTTPFMTWSESPRASTVSTSSFAIVTTNAGVVDFTFLPASMNKSGPFVYEVGLTNGPSVYKQGTFVIKPSPYASGGTATGFPTVINLALVLPSGVGTGWSLSNGTFSGTFSGSGAGITGMVDTVARAWATLASNLASSATIEAAAAYTAGTNAYTLAYAAAVYGTNAYTAATNALAAAAATGNVLRASLVLTGLTLRASVIATGDAARVYTDFAHATNTAQQITLNELVTLMDTHSQSVERVYWVGSTNREAYTTNTVAATGYGTVDDGSVSGYIPVSGVYTGVTDNAPTPMFREDGNLWAVQFIFTNWFMAESGTPRWVLNTGSEPSPTDPTGTYYPYGHEGGGNPSFALNEAWAPVIDITTNLVADLTTNQLTSASVSNLLAQVAALGSLAFQSSLTAEEVGAVAAGHTTLTARAGHNGLGMIAADLSAAGGLTNGQPVGVATNALNVPPDAAWLWLGPPLRLISGVVQATVPGGDGVGYAYVTNIYANADWLLPASETATGILTRITWALQSTNATRRWYITTHDSVSNSTALLSFYTTNSAVTVRHSNGFGTLVTTNLLRYPFGQGTCRMNLTGWDYPASGIHCSCYVIRVEGKLLYP